MRTMITGTAAAALLWVGAVQAQETAPVESPVDQVEQVDPAAPAEPADQDRLQTRQRLRDPTLHEGEVAADRIRARVHEALAERAGLPGGTPELAGVGEGTRQRIREHAATRDAEAIAAERHARRVSGAGAGQQAPGAGAGPGDGTQPRDGSGGGDCVDAAGQRRTADVHGGAMRGGGPGGGGMGCSSTRAEHVSTGRGRGARSGARAAAELIGDGFGLDAFERELVEAALERAGGNKTRAAQLLGVTRRRLYSLLASHGLAAVRGETSLGPT